MAFISHGAEGMKEGDEVVGHCLIGCGSRIRPARGQKGESKFGFTIGQRVRVAGKDFNNWVGHVRAFNGTSVAVDLDEPPKGEQPNGQWFLPSHLVSYTQ